MLKATAEQAAACRDRISAIEAAGSAAGEDLATLIAMARHGLDCAQKDLQIERMVSRFLGWRLPEDFSPDAGISFNAIYNEGTKYEARHEPVGTNLFSASQAESMVRYMTEGASDQ